MSELTDRGGEPEPLDLAAVRHLDLVSVAAWPPLDIEKIDNWLVRHGGGLGRRVNSVAPFATGPGEMPLAERIAAVEAAYKAKDMPPRFQVSPSTQPDDLDDELALRGYEIEAPVFLMTRAADVPAKNIGAVDVRIEEAASDAWWEMYLEGFHRDARPVVARANDYPVFASVENAKGGLDAIGLGVAGDGWFGIFAMYTRTDARRRGLGSAIIAAFAEYAADKGRPKLYLQVERSNAAARAVYARLGFSVAYAYHYRTLWEPK